MPPRALVPAGLLLGSCLLLACGGKGSTASGGGGGAGGSFTGPDGPGPASTSTGAGGKGAGGGGGSAPGCKTEAWPTYGHDARRTFASEGCVAGALKTSWRYAPAPPMGKNVTFLFHAVAQPDAAFLQWSATDAMYLGTTAADRVSTSGQRVWTWDSGTDTNLGNWASIAWNYLVLNDDGLWYLDLTTGMKVHDIGVDDWGQTIPSPERLYTVNSAHIDGPGIYVGAYDAMEKQLWAKNTYGVCRIDSGDTEGGIALDGGKLFYAPAYSLPPMNGPSFASGVYAFDPATGAPAWNKPTTPASAISAGDGHVYLVEGTQGMTSLVARAQADGAVVWSVPVQGPGSQAPVLAGGLVIVATAMDIAAFDPAGKPAWTAPIPGAASSVAGLNFSGGCLPNVQIAFWTGLNVPTTTLAAATGSDTLVVTAPDGLHVLSLRGGKEVWRGAVPQAMGPVRDPVIVGTTVYVADGTALLSLAPR